jgi:hypothetical protein
VRSFGSGRGADRRRELLLLLRVVDEKADVSKEVWEGSIGQSGLGLGSALGEEVERAAV